MHGLTKWFHKQAAKDERAVFLEDALFDGRFLGYAYYRMRLFLGRSLLSAGLHITEVIFLSFIFAPRLLAAALLVRTATGFAISWWWGALEVMRADVRRLRRGRKSFLIARALSQWLGLSVLAALVVIACFAAWIAFDMFVARRSFGLFHFYVLANGLRLACALCVRTLHSGVYALRRVYRPLWSLVVVDVLIFGGALLLWPLVGPWSVPSMLVVSCLLSNALTLHYTLPLYRFLALFDGPITLSRPTRAFVRSNLAGMRFFLGGCAYALTKVDSVLLFALYYGMRGQPGGYELLLLFYVIGPFIRGSSDWAQLYYFDLKRLELEVFTNFKRTFDRGLDLLSGLVAGLCWILAAICGTLFLQKNLGMVYLVLAAFLLVRSRLAHFQIRAFAENRLGALLASGLFLFAGAFSFRAFLQDSIVRIEWFTLLLLLAMLLLRRREPRVHLRRDEADILVPLDWLGGLKASRDRVRVRSVELCVEVDDWSVEQFARSLGKRIRNSGEATLLGGKRIVWWEREMAKRKLGDDWIWRRGVGMIESFRSTPYVNDGCEALRCAEAEWLLGSVNRPPAGREAAAKHLQALKELFRDMFPDGTLFEPAANGGRMLGSFSSVDRREIMHGIVQYSKNFFQIVRSGKYDVTALFQRNEITLVFIVDKAVHKKARRIWRGLIGAFNVGLAIGPVPGTATEEVNRRVLPAPHAFKKHMVISAGAQEFAP